MDSLTIAIVDDDAGLRKALQRLLRVNGFRTVCFASAAEYLAAAPERPDCLLLDLHLGEMSGLELEARLREASALPPVLFITAQDELAEEAVRSGKPCLAKPFDETELLAALSRVIGRPQGRAPHAPAVLVLLATLLLAAFGAPVLASEAPGERSPVDVLRHLVEGNRRFVSGQTRHPHAGADWRSRLTKGQHPEATLLACSDSRVPPELIFDAGFGDLFVVRVAGNIVTTDTAGSVDYGFLHAGTPLVLVLGHEGCGAVTAALGDYREEPLAVQYLLKQIVPSFHHLPEGPPEARLAAAVEANTRQSVAELRSAPAVRERVQAGTLHVQGGVYDLDTGRVDLLDPPPGF